MSNEPTFTARFDAAILACEAELAICDAATAGPLIATIAGGDGHSRAVIFREEGENEYIIPCQNQDRPGTSYSSVFADCDGNTAQTDANAAFIAASRTGWERDLRAKIAMLQAGRDAEAAWQAVYHEFESCHDPEYIQTPEEEARDDSPETYAAANVHREYLALVEVQG